MISAVGPGESPGGRGAVCAADGPTQSDNERLERLRQRIAAAVRRTCPPWLARQSDDIVQVLLLRLAGTGQETEGERRFSSIYIEKAAYGATVDEIRRHSRRQEEPLPEGSGSSDLEAAAINDPERQTASAEIGHGIRECLATLGPPRRLAVTLYLQGCSVPEAAQRLGWTTKRTENLVYRGLADLRSCLSRKGLAP
jgi:RNA polymerase sigma-70 factor (ECF subfamily)